jgi:hypothetical protein
MNETKSALVSTKFRTFFTVAAFLFFIFYGWRAWKSGDNDFVAYFNAGTRILNGKSPYAAMEATPFRYLPITAFFFAPFALLPFKIARLLFFVTNFAAVVMIYRSIGKQVGGLATLCLVALFFRFHNHDFQNAQVNPLLLLLFFAWWRLRGRNLPLAALLFSVFASFKIVPFAIGIPLLYLRRWNEIQWIALWTVVLNFLPIFFVDNGAMVFKDWYDQAKLIDYPASMFPNIQSLQSALWWMLEGRLSAAFFSTAVPILQGAILISILLLTPTEETTPGFGRKADWAFASTLAATVLLAPLAWKHNYLQFLPLAYLWFREDPKFREKRTRVVYGIALFGMVILPSAIGIWNRGFSDRLYLMVWAGLVVLFLGLVQARRAQILPIEK